MPRRPKRRIPTEQSHAEKVNRPEEEAGETRAPVLVRVKKVKREDVVPPSPEKTRKLREAMPTELALTLTTSIALKTTSKFCGQWFHLKRGESVTATASQIAYLRSCDLVE